MPQFTSPKTGDNVHIYLIKPLKRIKVLRTVPARVTASFKILEPLFLGHSLMPWFAAHTLNFLICQKEMRTATLVAWDLTQALLSRLLLWCNITHNVCVCVCVCVCSFVKFYHVHRSVWSSPQSRSITTSLPPLLSNPWQSGFSISVILSFQECYLNGIIQYVLFGDWLFFPTQSNSLEIHPSCYMYQHFALFYCWPVIHSRDVPQFV